MSLSISALFLAGLLTFLSPCVLPLIPVYLAMLAGTSSASLREGGHRKRLVLSAVSFAVGLSAVFVMLGLAASAAGRLLSGHRALLLQLAGLAVFLAGLKIMGFLHVPGLDRESRPWLKSLKRRGGLAWPFLFGAAFALGWSPCVGPMLASALALAGTAGNATHATLYLAAYSLGLTAPLVAVAAVAPLALRLLDRAKRHLRVFELASGSLLALLGLLFITGHQATLLGGSWGGSAGSSVVASSTVAPSDEGPATCAAGAREAAPETAPMESPVEVGQLPAMLEFVSAGCPICQRMAPVVAAAERNCSAHGVRVQQIDLATTAGRAHASRYGVLGVPTFLFLDRQAVEVARLVGQQPEQTLVQSLEVLAGQRCDGFRRLANPTSPGS
jgi:cytochrome c-type biogenesis protein